MATSRRWCCASRPVRGGPWALTQLRITSSSGPEGAQATLILRTATAGTVSVPRRRWAGGCRLHGPGGGQRRAVSLRKFEVRAVSEGQDAQGEAVVTWNTKSQLSRRQRQHRYRGGGNARLARSHQPHRAQPCGPASPASPCRQINAEDHVSEGLGAARSDCRDGRHTRGAVHRPAPDPRSHDAAGIRGAAPSGVCRSAARDLTLATMDHSTPTRTEQVFGGVPVVATAAAGRFSSWSATAPRPALNCWTCTASCAASCTSSVRNWD